MYIKLYYTSIQKKHYEFKIINNKIKYIIKKHMIYDLSDESSLFFLPPLHPFIQLYCKGELWHPRTKIGNDSPNIKIKQPLGNTALMCLFEFIKDCDYLISNKTIAELELIYKSYISNDQIKFWLKKYLKYKNKYLKYKNK